MTGQTEAKTANSAKTQRDRFLAFAFASADLFVEIGESGEISFAIGAARSLTGIDHTTLTGQNWLDIFTRHDRGALARMRKDAQEAERCGPLLARLSDTLDGGRDVIVTGIKMPGSKNFYMTVSFPNELLMKMARLNRVQEEACLLDREDFLHAATEACALARTIGENADLTLLDIPETAKIREKLGDDLWNRFTQSLTDILGAHAIDGHAIAEIADGRYGIVHDSDTDTGTLLQQIADLGRQTDPEGEGFEILGKTVTADLESLSERETSKALVYTINEFGRKGINLNIETLNAGFKAYVSVNAQKVHQFKTMVEQLNFNLEFQPVVNMETASLSHFESLSRFKAEGSTQEWIIFGEDIGMAADLDIAVCERVINYLTYKGANNRMKFAVNLSGQSIQNEQFFKALCAKLDMRKELAKRMIFEITESTTITELDMVNHFIELLQGKGYQVCLDDFGAGSASFQYIQKLHVDYVKIDGQYTRKILASPRDQVMVKNLCRLCADLNTGVIAERIETKEQMEKMKELGAALGQGYYYGYPQAQPEFDPFKVPAAPPKPR